MKLLRFLLAVALLSAALSLPVLAWDPSELPSGVEVETPGYPIEFDGKLLFHARISAKLFKAQQRAQVISERIHKLAQDPLFRPESIIVKNAEHGSDIMAGDQVIMPIYGFLAKVEGRNCRRIGPGLRRKNSPGHYYLPTRAQFPPPGCGHAQDPDSPDRPGRPVHGSLSDGTPPQSAYQDDPEDTGHQDRRL